MDSDDMQEQLGGAVEFLKARALVILFLLLIAGGVYAYLFVIPRPASLDVSIVELDGGTVNLPVEVSIADASGHVVSGGANTLVEGGSAHFSKLPSQQDLLINADAGKAYLPLALPINLKSADSAGQTLSLERRNKLSFGSSTIPGLLPMGCSDGFTVDVANGGNEPFDVALVAEGDADMAASVHLPEAVTVPAGGHQLIPANVTLTSITGPASDQPVSKTLKLRIKHTQVSLPLALSITSPLQATLDPSDIPIADRSDRAQSMRLTNSGKAPLTNLAFSFFVDNRLASACGQAGEKCFSIERLGTADVSQLPPGSSLSFGIRIQGLGDPAALPPGQYLGQLVVKASCLSPPGLTANLKLDLPAPAGQ